MAQSGAQQVESLEHAPNSGQGSGFPPFEKDTFPSQIIWLVLAFVALYLLMSRIGLPRVDSILESRRKHIDGDLAEANRLKGESDEAMAVYEKSLADARGRAQTLANEARERETAAAESARKALDAKLNAKIAESEKAIAGRKTAAMANVQGIAADATTAIVERLIGSPPAPGTAQAAVADVLKR